MKNTTRLKRAAAALALSLASNAYAETYFCTVSGMSLSLAQARNPQTEPDYGESFEQNGMKRKFEITVNGKEVLVRQETPTLKGPRVQIEKYTRLPGFTDPDLGYIKPENVTAIRTNIIEMLNVLALETTQRDGYFHGTLAAVTSGVANGWHLQCKK